MIYIFVHTILSQIWTGVCLFLFFALFPLSSANSFSSKYFPISLITSSFSHKLFRITVFQFSSVQSLSHVRLCDPMNCSMPALPVHHQLLESTQTHVHWVGDAIQPSHSLSSPSPPAIYLSQHQSLFKWVSFLHQVAKVLEFQLQKSFQWTPRTDFL